MQTHRVETAPEVYFTLGGGWIRENKKTTICNLVVSGRRGTGEAAGGASSRVSYHVFFPLKGHAEGNSSCFIYHG